MHEPRGDFKPPLSRADNDSMTHGSPTRPVRLLVVLAVLALDGCSSQDHIVPTRLPPRTFFRGFSSIPPRFDSTLVVPVVQMWAKRADAGLILSEPPWDYLLAGGDAALAVRTQTLPLAQFFRALGL